MLEGAQIGKGPGCSGPFSRSVSVKKNSLRSVYQFPPQSGNSGHSGGGSPEATATTVDAGFGAGMNMAAAARITKTPRVIILMRPFSHKLEL